MSEWRHVPLNTYAGAGPRCTADDEPWPCDAERMRLRAETLELALRLCRNALRERERKAGKVISSDEALFATATLEGLRMAPDLDARIRALQENPDAREG